MYLIIVLYLLCAAMFTISKSALDYADPIFFVAVRMILAGLVLFSYLIIDAKFISKKNIFYNFSKDWSLLAQIIIFHIYIAFICDLCALKDISGTESSFLYDLSPFITALGSYIWFNEKMTLKKWIGLLIGFSALAPGILQKTDFLLALKPRLITLLAVISSAYGWIVLRELVKDRQYSPIFVNAFGMFFGGLGALITSYFFESWHPTPVTQWCPFIQLTLLIILVANILFYNLYGYLLNFYTATFLSFAGFMCPLFTAILEWFFLGTAIQPTIIFSFCMVIIGLYIFYQDELRQGYIVSEK